MSEASDTFRTAIERAGLTVEAVFVPWSQSRGKDEKDDRGNPRYSLNWRVTLYRARPRVNYNEEREAPIMASERVLIVTTDYSAGVGHCPAYEADIKTLGGKNCLMRDAEIRKEVETGKHWRDKTPILPDTLDVVHALLSDGDAIEHPSFESWASDCGYDPDSRKAEAVYRVCLDIGLRVQNALGHALWSDLRIAAQDY